MLPPSYASLSPLSSSENNHLDVFQNNRLYMQYASLSFLYALRPLLSQDIAIMNDEVAFMRHESPFSMRNRRTSAQILA